MARKRKKRILADDAIESAATPATKTGYTSGEKTEGDEKKPKVGPFYTADGKDCTEEEFIKEALERFDRAYERDRENIDEAYDDLRFRAGGSGQWPEKDLKRRNDAGRPCLTINLIPAFIRQITGDMRQMKPAINVVPVDDEGDEEIAARIKGMIRYIENRSDAQAVYAIAADSQVACGIGHWEVTIEYAADKSMNRELRIVGIDDSVMVLWDADALSPVRDDAGCCFVPVDMTRKKFEAKWPDKTAVDFNKNEASHAQGWVSEDYIRVAAYWMKIPVTKTVVMFPDGSVDDVTEVIEESGKLAALEQVVAAMNEKALASGGGVIEIQERPGVKLCRYLITSESVLEGPFVTPGRHIPVVPAIGEEIRIGRKIVRHGIIRQAKDAQRLNNYFNSAQAEIVALQPKAPWLATEKMTEKYTDMWETANSENHAVLHFTPDPLMAGSQPSRIAPPVNSQGIHEGIVLSTENMKSIIGIHNAGLGDRSNETSGKAIVARQREGDVGAFVYIDNFSRAIRRTGEILVDLIPHIYDSEREVRIIGDDGKMDRIKINQPVGTSQDYKVQNDLTVGSYDVVLEVGPSYTTRREESRESITALIGKMPEIAPLLLDIFAEHQDWPGKEKIAKRFETLLPPEIREMEKKESGEGREQTQIGPDGQPIQPQPSPEQQAQMAQMQQAQQMQQMAAQAAAEKMKSEVSESQAKTKQAQASAVEAEAKAKTAIVNLEIAQVKLAGAKRDFMAPPEKTEGNESPVQ